MTQMTVVAMEKKKEEKKTKKKKKKKKKKTINKNKNKEEQQGGGEGRVPFRCISLGSFFRGYRIRIGGALRSGRQANHSEPRGAWNPWLKPLAGCARERDEGRGAASLARPAFGSRLGQRN